MATAVTIIAIQSPQLDVDVEGGTAVVLGCEVLCESCVCPLGVVVLVVLDGVVVLVVLDGVVVLEPLDEYTPLS
jgi:hypothetical protein